MILPHSKKKKKINFIHSLSAQALPEFSRISIILYSLKNKFISHYSFSEGA